MALTHTRYFRWDDTGAPTLNGTVGSLIALLDACLVGTSGVAYGTGGGTKYAAGWTKEYSGTNKAAYRNAVAAGGTGCYVRVIDNASGVAGAKEAFATVFSSMSDIDTGTNMTPTGAQLSTGSVWRKSTTADSTARKWICVADELTLYLSVECDPLAGNFDRAIYMAGDFNSFVAGDGYAYAIAGKTSANTATGNEAWLSTVATTGTPGSNNGLWIGKPYSLTGDPVRAAICAIGTPGANGGSGMGDPSIGTSMLFFAPALIATESIIRGKLRGAFVALNDLSARAFGSDINAPAGMPVGSKLALLVANPAISAAQCRMPVECNLAWE